jgi:hypothetical protein
MMMASIPGDPLPDTLPSDALLCAAKESRGAATTSGLWVGVGRCYAQHGAETLQRRSGCWRQRRCSDDRRRQTAARVQHSPHRCRLHGLRVEQQEGNGAVIRIKYSLTYSSHESSVLRSAHAARALTNGVQVHLAGSSNAQAKHNHRRRDNDANNTEETGIAALQKSEYKTVTSISKFRDFDIA